MHPDRRRLWLRLAWLVPGLFVFGWAAWYLIRSPASTPRPPVRLPTPFVGALAGVTVVLDPGHGGADSGAVRNGVCEAALTYRTAAELAGDIRRQGGRVLFTVRSRMLDPQLTETEPPVERPRDAVLAVNGEPLRERESPRPLWLRAGVGRRAWDACVSAHSDCASNVFFLSLHYDDYHRESVQGALVCVDRRMASVPALARLLAARFTADGLARHDVYHGLPGLAARRLGVLDPKYNPVPQRLLVELATISNETDALSADEPEWRQTVDSRIVDALIAAHQKTAMASRAVPAVQ